MSAFIHCLLRLQLLMHSIHWMHKCVMCLAIGKINQHYFPAFFICCCDNVEICDPWLTFIGFLTSTLGTSACGPHLWGAASSSACATLFPAVTGPTLVIRADLRSEQRLLLRIPGKVIWEVSLCCHGTKVHPGARGRIIKCCKHGDEADPARQWYRMKPG